MTTLGPKAPPPNPDGIPAELKALRRWVAWRFDFRDKWCKLPVSPVARYSANMTDPTHWLEFDEALEFYRKNRLGGVGFVFAADDGYTGIDLDACRDPATGALQDWASEVVRKMASYAEVSPSGKGVKIIVRAKLKGDKNRRGNIEVYDRKKYFTVTGAHLPGTPTTVEARQTELDWLADRLAADERNESPGLGLSDEEIIARACKGPPFLELWKGDISNYESQSEADLALLNMLVSWLGTEADPARLERLFGQSELGQRKKWKRKDYREVTVQKALDGRGYQPPEPRGAAPVSTRISQVSQVLPGKISTERAPPTKSILSPEEEKESVRIAFDLAATLGDKPDWEAMFVLARRLRSLLAGKTGGGAFEKAVQAYCKAANKNVEDYWFTFLVIWAKVKLAEGENILEWAVNRAVAQPVMLPATALNEKYALMASIAYHLADFRRPKPFWLSGKEIAPLLKMNERTVYRIITLLEQDKVIKCVMSDYSYKKGLAREYLYTGAPPKEDQNSIVA